jgi:hypothetical protein
MTFATEVEIKPGTHTLLAVPIAGDRIIGSAFLATVTLSITGSTAFVVSPERNAGQGEAYSRQPDGAWLGDRGRTILLHARV